MFYDALTMVSSNTSNNASTPAISSSGAEQYAVHPHFLLEAFVEHAPTAWALLDTNLNYTVVSRRWREELQVEGHDVEGLNHFDLFEETSFWKEAFENGLNGVSTEGQEEQLRTRDGQSYRVRWSLKPLGDQSVEALALFISVEDQHVSAETKALRQSERLHRIMSEYSLDLVCLHNSDGRYEYVSPSVERVLGYTSDELVGTRPDDLIHPDDLDSSREEPMLSLFGAGSGERVRYRARHKDGSYLWLETSINFVADEDGNIEYVLTNSRDVSERVEAKDALRHTNRALEQRNRELQDFAYVASHDLQEPLRKIRAFADLLQEDYDEHLDDMGVYYLDRMHDAATRMSHLISDLLAFSRVTTKTRPFQEVDLHEVLNQVISDLELQISELEGAVEIEELPVIEADPTQMRQLFQNLVANALKFHRPGVRPVVRIAEEPDAQPTREDGGSQPMVNIIVEDNGIGFDEKYADRIFSPFERLHRRGEYPGTGMGLAISRRIIERHGGSIAVQSVPDEGSTFVVSLPKSQENNSLRTETSDP